MLRFRMQCSNQKDALDSVAFPGIAAGGAWAVCHIPSDMVEWVLILLPFIVELAAYDAGALGTCSPQVARSGVCQLCLCVVCKRTAMLPCTREAAGDV